MEFIKSLKQVTRFRCFSVLLLCLSVKGAPDGFEVNVQPDGNFTVSVAGTVWLISGPAFFNNAGRRWASDSDLIQVDRITNKGQGYVDHTFRYAYGHGIPAVETNIRTYTDNNYAIFTQHFLVASTNTSLGGQDSFNATMSGFPTLQLIDPDEPLGFLSFGGYMFGDTDKTTGRFGSNTSDINDGMSGGPLALFNSQGQTIIISPYDNFMAASIWQDGSHVTWGIMGGVDSIPANFTYKTIMYYGATINTAFFSWGNVLRKQFGIWPTIYRGLNRTNDPSLKYLGYWTDNGAYYYYNPESGKNYEDTLKDVKKYAQDNDIPYKYVQIDSWWYPKDAQYNAVTSWTPIPAFIPDGLRNLSDSTGWQYVAHNRYWSKQAVYAKQNNGSFDWIIGQYGSLPNDLEFWRYIFKQAKQWGLTVYEQDWMNIQTRYMAELQTSLTLGRAWLMQMGQAAAENNITIQYCMATARHAYQSLEIPPVTQARVSDDYHYLRPDQWKIGVTSLFAWAMAVNPSKDTFWTSEKQPGNPFNKTEQYPALEAVVATLSKGPVGPSDGIGYTNKNLLMRCCRQDGMLLKPSSAARAIDKQIITDAFNFPTKMGEVWMAQSFIPVNGSDQEHGILFAADITGQTKVQVSDLGFNVLRSGVYYPYNDLSQWRYFNSSTVINLQGCSKKNFCLYHFMPVFNGPVTAILGEGDKWIPMSTQRIANVKILPTHATLSIKGAPSELVPFWYIASGQLQQTTCIITTSGDVTGCDLTPHTYSSTPKSTSSGSPGSQSTGSTRMTTETSGSPTKSSTVVNPTTTHPSRGARVAGRAILIVFLVTLLNL